MQNQPSYISESEYKVFRNMEALKSYSSVGEAWTGLTFLKDCSKYESRPFETSKYLNISEKLLPSQLQTKIENISTYMFAKHNMKNRIQSLILSWVLLWKS